MLKKLTGNYTVVNSTPGDEEIKPFIEYFSDAHKRFILCRYYDSTEGRLSNVPDVLDVIDKVLDNLEDRLDFLSERVGTVLHNRRPKSAGRDFKSLEEHINCLYKIRDAIIDDFQSRYYVLELDSASSEFIINYSRVELASLSVWRPLFNERTTKYEAVAESIILPILPTLDYMVVTLETQFIQDYWGLGEVGLGVPETQSYVSLNVEDIEKLNIKGSVVHKCKKCGKYFRLTEGHIDWYKVKGLSLPNHCASCREERRNAF